MWVIKDQNPKFISYLIMLISLFILFLVTYNQYEQLQINLDVNSSLENEVNTLSWELNELSILNKSLKSDDSEIKKYLSEFNEEELIKYIFDYVESYNTQESQIYVTDISFTEWVKNDLWFMQSNINISANVSNYSTMKRFLDFFVSSNSKYNFFIDNFTFPNDWREWSFNISIPLKIYYN